MKCEKIGTLEITEIKLLNFSIFPETEAQYRDIKRFNQDHVAARGKLGPKTDVLISRQPTTQRFPSLVSYFHTLLKVVHIPNG